MMSDKIFIYGVPGAGKTTFSIELAKKLGFPIVEADALRNIARKEKTRKEDPFVYVGTKEAFREFGALSEENVMKGLLAVRKSMERYINEEIAKYTNGLIMEAAFLDPNVLQNQGKLILIVTSDEQKHWKQYFTWREKTDDDKETFLATRMVQDYFIKEAGELGVMVLENNGDMQKLVEKIA